MTPQDDLPPSERGILQAQLSNAITLRVGQDHVLWAIFGAFWASNSVLLVALFKDGNFPANTWVGVVIAGVGVLLSLGWLLIQFRALAYIRQHESLIDSLQDRLLLGDELRILSKIEEGIPARDVMCCCSWVGIVGWFGALVAFLTLAL